MYSLSYDVLSLMSLFGYYGIPPLYGTQFSWELNFYD